LCCIIWRIGRFYDGRRSRSLACCSRLPLLTLPGLSTSTFICAVSLSLPWPVPALFCYSLSLPVWCALDAHGGSRWRALPFMRLTPACRAEDAAGAALLRASREPLLRHAGGRRGLPRCANAACVDATLCWRAKTRSRGTDEPRDLCDCHRLQRGGLRLTRHLACLAPCATQTCYLRAYSSSRHAHAHFLKTSSAAYLPAVLRLLTCALRVLQDAKAVGLYLRHCLLLDAPCAGYTDLPLRRTCDVRGGVFFLCLSSLYGETPGLSLIVPRAGACWTRTVSNNFFRRAGCGAELRALHRCG